MIIDFRAKCESISETAKFVKSSCTALVKAYRAWQNGTVQNQQCDEYGAPRTIEDRDERRLRRCFRANRHAIVEKMTAQMNQGAINS